ncbi:DUF4249 family protein [Pontibacter harenae]|uniref:DUF4249 family protein n=1 Tax=Pontibacter harenae TaxID=2894083 RepID=UPI001E2E1CDD|nr:DUF4249 family protein [Pontibacter harenae]MCC9167044.1 DUF4249 domain-containing protein [Pontibacter harenae]
MKCNYILWLLLIMALFGCEDDVTLDLPAGEEQLVVEGHIEQGAPPIVVVTRTVPVFSNATIQDRAARFVHGAEVVVRSGGSVYTLQEVPAAAFTPELKRLLSEQFAVPPIQLATGSSFVFYAYTTDELQGEVGKNYLLQIKYEDQLLTSTTTIPQLNPLLSLFTQPHPNPQEDSLVSLFYRYADPDTLGNSIRYFTKRNSEPFYPGLLSSVFTDELINGAPLLSFPLARGVPQGQELDEETAGYFGKGDTVTIRWAAIDLPHYRFWSTLEAERSSNGSPIGSPKITGSNIKGGLGIWGGYGVTYHSMIVE